MEGLALPSREERYLQGIERDKQLRQVRKEIKHNRKPRSARSREWSRTDPEGMDAPACERVMPVGEREGRRGRLVAALAKLEREGDSASSPGSLVAAGDAAQRGVVTEVSSGLCRVAVAGRTLVCALRGALRAEETGYTHVIAVGDIVRISTGDGAQGVVEEVLPRRSALSRPDVFLEHLEQVLVANVDQLLVVTSWRDPPLWFELVDRYLIAAQRSHLTVLIVVNKVDLADRQECLAALQPYQAMGYRVLFTSAVTGEGVGELRDVLRDQSTVLAGLSGVGKSSLVAAVEPGLQLRVGDVSEQGGQGRHTTTQVRMWPLAMGGFVVDTPGIREFGLVGLARQDLARYYPDMSAVAPQCQFADCSHRHEPGCAILAALRDGAISHSRYHSYVKIYESLPG